MGEEIGGRKGRQKRRGAATSHMHYAYWAPPTLRLPLVCCVAFTGVSSASVMQSLGTASSEAPSAYLVPVGELKF